MKVAHILKYFWSEEHTEDLNRPRRLRSTVTLTSTSLHPTYQTVIHTVTNTKCRIDTDISPDDGHIIARNMQRKEINILRKIVHQVGFVNKKIRRLLVQSSVRRQATPTFWRNVMVSLNKSVLVHAMKAYRGSKGMNPLILNLGNWWRKAVSFTPRLYSRGKQSRCPRRGGSFQVKTQLVYNVYLLYWRHVSALTMGHLQVTRHMAHAEKCLQYNK